MFLKKEGRGVVMRKKISVLVLLSSLIALEFSPAVLASASEVNQEPVTNVVKVNDTLKPNIVSKIELDELVGKEETTIVDSDGNYLGKLSVQEEVNIISRQAGDKYKLANKTYSVSFIGLTCNFGYKVTVKNKKITKAYGTWSNGFLWATSLGTPYYTSTTSGVKGQTSVAVDWFGWNTTVRLYGNISGNYLVTGMKLS